MELDENVLSIIHEMSKIPPAIKAWKAPVIELLNDPRLFNTPFEMAEKWRPIVKALFDGDRTVFQELLCMSW